MLTNRNGFAYDANEVSSELAGSFYDLKEVADTAKQAQRKAWEATYYLNAKTKECEDVALWHNWQVAYDATVQAGSAQIEVVEAIDAALKAIKAAYEKAQAAQSLAYDAQELANDAQNAVDKKARIVRAA